MKPSTTLVVAGSIVSILFLCLPAFYNGSALLFPDSIGYVHTGFFNTPIQQRVWTYSGWVRHLSLAETLWSVVLVQALVTVLSIHLMFKYLLKLQEGFVAVLYVLVASMVTAMGFHCSRIMPDFFTPLILLHLSLLLFASGMSKKDRGLSAFLLLLSLSMHNSHLVIAVVVLLALGILAVFPPVRTLYCACEWSWKRVIQVVAVALSSFLLVCTLHWSIGGGFQATQGGSIFLFARLCDFQIAQDYLDEHCEGDDSGLCTSRNWLSHGSYFLWLDLPASIGSQGGWTAANQTLYGEIVKDILTTPKYFVRYVIRSAEATFMQFFYMDYNPLAEVEGQGMGGHIAVHYPHYKTAMKGSRQDQATYYEADTAFKNQLQYTAFFLSILILLIAFLTSTTPPRIKAVTLMLVLGMLSNAFVMGAISGVYDRYQSRVAWLITLPAFWVLCRFVEIKFARSTTTVKF